MKFNPIILFIIFLFSCKNETVIEFGKKHKENLLQINIDTIDSYKNLYNSVDSILCSNENSQIQLLIYNDDVNYKVNLINNCSDIIVCFKSKNILSIINDSIYKNSIGTYKFDSLHKLIIKDYLNNGLNPKLSVAPYKFILSFIQPNTLDNATLKNRLIRSIEAYKHTNLGNENLKLSLMLDISENFDFDNVQKDDSIYKEMEFLLKEWN